MRCIALALGETSEMTPLTHYKPSILLKALDKPLLAHALEMLYLAGIREVHLLLHYLPEKIERFAEDGKRWGLQIFYHLVKDPNCPFQAIRPLAMQWKDEKVLFGNIEKTPFIEKSFLEEGEKCSKESLPFLFISKKNETTFWGIFNAEELADFSAKTSLAQFYGSITSKKFSSLKALPFLCCESLKKLQETNIRLLTETFPYDPLPPTAKMVEPGIVFSRSIELHPRAEISPPIFIGEDCRIMAGVKLGPNVVVENHCLIDCESTVSDSLICERSYIGEGLEVKNSIVNRNTLINLEIDSVLEVRDDFILGEMKGPSFARRFFGKAFQWLTAFFLIVVSAPIFIFMKMTCRLEKKSIVEIPAKSLFFSQNTFDLYYFEARPGRQLSAFQQFFSTLPTVVNILKGQMHFVGLPPRTVSETNELPSNWQAIYLKAKAGWVSPWDVELTKKTETFGDLVEEQYAFEAYYCTKSTVMIDLKILGEFFLTKLKNL